MEAKFPAVMVSRIGESVGKLASHGDRLKWVTKPVKEMDLICRVTDALSGRQGEFSSNPENAGAVDEPFAIKFPGKVLLVEDQPMNQKIVSMMLQKLGYEVRIASDGREAVDMVKAGGSFDLVLMDLQMPVMGGIEAATEIRRNFLLAKQPYIVALTGHALTGVREECRKAGMNQFMTKPVSLDDLRRCLREGLGTSTRIAA
jgi:CheY-like chemotaxis protein